MVIWYNEFYQTELILKGSPHKACPQTVLKELLYLVEDNSQQ
jgi:hypothetical protein